MIYVILNLYYFGIIPANSLRATSWHHDKHTQEEKINDNPTSVTIYK